MRIISSCWLRAPAVAIVDEREGEVAVGLHADAAIDGAVEHVEESRVASPLVSRVRTAVCAISMTTPLSSHDR